MTQIISKQPAVVTKNVFVYSQTNSAQDKERKKDREGDRRESGCVWEELLAAAIVESSQHRTRLRAAC